MFSLTVAVFAVFPLLMALFAIWFSTRVPRRELKAAADAYPELGEFSRKIYRSRFWNLLVAIFLAWAISNFDNLGRGLVVAPYGLGLCMLLYIFYVEVRYYKAARTPGVASLESRESRRYLPIYYALATFTSATALLVLFSIGNVQGVEDDQGRVGRAISGVCADGTTTLASPFPGWYYTLPSMVGLFALLLAYAFVTWFIAKRPRNGSDARLVEIDDALRRVATEGAVSSLAVGLGMNLVILSAMGVQAVGADCVNDADNFVWLIAVYGAAIFLGLSLAAVGITRYLVPLSAEFGALPDEVKPDTTDGEKP